MADCSKTEVFLTERKRMCLSLECEDCPLSVSNNGRRLGCVSFAQDYPVEAVAAMQIWSDEHPAPKPKTYADDFFEKHPNAPKRANGMPMAFRCQVYGCSCGKHEANMINGCEMCWNEPYKEGEQ